MATGGNLNFGAVFAQSVRSLKAGWLWFCAAIVVLRLAPRIALTLVHLDHYRLGSHALGPYLADAGETVALSFAAFLSFAFVIAVCLEQAAGRPAKAAFATTLHALPPLAVVWLLTELGTIVSLWFTWLSPGLRGANLMSLAFAQGAAGLSALLVNLVSLVGFGLLPAVIVAERRGLLASAATAWRMMQDIRWKIIGLFLLANLPNLLVFTFTMVWAATTPSHRGVNIYLNPFVIWGSAILLYIAEVLWAVVLASSYLERTRDRAGILARDVAHVFA